MEFHTIDFTMFNPKKVRSNLLGIPNGLTAIPYVGFDLYNESLFIYPSKQKGFDSLSKLAHNQSILNSSAL